MEFIIFAINYNSKIHNLWFKKNDIIKHIDNNMILDFDNKTYQCDSSYKIYKKIYPENFKILNTLKHISDMRNIILNYSFSINTFILNDYSIYKDCSYSISTYTFSIPQEIDDFELIQTAKSLPDFYISSPIDYYIGSLSDIFPTSETIEDTFTYVKNKLK